MTKSSSDDVVFVQNIAKTSVLVIGDIMLDRFVYGRVDRISPESPVPVLTITRQTRMLGGAGNTLSNLAHLGCDAKILSLIGEDDDGMEIQNLIAELGLETDGIIVSAEKPTIVKTRYLAGHQQLLRADFEQIHALGTETERRLIETCASMIKDVQAVILSDYGKGLLSNSVIRSIIDQAREYNIPVIVDPKGRDYSKYKGATAVTPNKKELSEATGVLNLNTDHDIVSASRNLLQSSGISYVVATRSKDGMSVISKDDLAHIRSAANIEVFDVSGAGDTVIATLAACMAAGAPITKAAAIANLAGSIVVTKVGTAPILSEELIQALSEHNTDSDVASNPAHIQKTSAFMAPLSTWQQAKEEIQRWKARGLKVGFTNGCFDIIHTGHVSYLNEARKRCDRLVVGLNKDTSVKILKGPTRPVHDENGRACVLSALGCVDMVILFGAENSGDDNTASQLISTIQPDIYFKGGDYTIEQIPETPAVRACGGIVELMPGYDGHSTTSSITKIKSSGAA